MPYNFPPNSTTYVFLFSDNLVSPKIVPKKSFWCAHLRFRFALHSATYKGDDASSMRRLLFYFRVWVTRGGGQGGGQPGPLPPRIWGIRKEKRRKNRQSLAARPSGIKILTQTLCFKGRVNFCGGALS